MKLTPPPVASVIASTGVSEYRLGDRGRTAGGADRSAVQGWNGREFQRKRIRVVPDAKAATS